jgi:hypothetical protein
LDDSKLELEQGSLPPTIGPKIILYPNELFGIPNKNLSMHVLQCTAPRLTDTSPTTTVCQIPMTIGSSRFGKLDTFGKGQEMLCSRWKKQYEKLVEYNRKKSNRRVLQRNKEEKVNKSKGKANTLPVKHKSSFKLFGSLVLY